MSVFRGFGSWDEQIAEDLISEVFLMCGVRLASSKADPPFPLALAITIQGPVCAAPQEDVELDDEAANAIEDIRPTLIRKWRETEIPVKRCAGV
jgi:hypothetical protein